MEAARLVADFEFDTIGTHRLGARAAITNGRGNGALKELGAAQGGVLRNSLLCHGMFSTRFSGPSWSRMRGWPGPGGYPGSANGDPLGRPPTALMSPGRPRFSASMTRMRPLRLLMAPTHALLAFDLR